LLRAVASGYDGRQSGHRSRVQRPHV